MDERKKLELKAKVALTSSFEEADRILEEAIGNKSMHEKMAFLRGMCNLAAPDPDRLVYQYYLEQIQKKFRQI